MRKNNSKKISNNELEEIFLKSENPLKSKLREIYLNKLAILKKMINKDIAGEIKFAKLFDFFDDEYNNPTSSGDFITIREPEAPIEDIVKEMIVEMGVIRENIVSKPVEKSSFGTTQISRAPDFGIEPENMRNHKGLLFEIEPLGKNLIKNKKHGATQAEEWFKLAGLSNRYDAIATNFTHWYLITANKKGYGTISRKFENPLMALEYIHAKYFGLDRMIFDFEEKNEQNINLFYKEFEVAMNKIAINLEKDSEYGIINADLTESDRILYFRSIFFRMLFIKILDSWKIIKRDPVGEYVLKTSKDAYYMRLKKVFFKVFNTPINERSGDVKIPELNDLPFLNGGLFRENEIESEFPSIELTGKAIEYIAEILNHYHYIPYSKTEDDDKRYISPKALGHIFEKTIDVAGGNRKETGTFYTPKKITNYITSESIEHYLIKETNKEIISYISKEEKESRIPIIKETIRDLDYYYNLNTNATNMITDIILSILANIKICDNSCGSGAFLDSAAEKLEKIYQKLYMYKGMSDLEMQNKSKKRTHNPICGIFKDIYSLRKHIITNNIYGVDIQKESIEIAKIRLWLWLINPYNVYTDKIMDIEVEPLPNIDYNILQGNSLVGFSDFDKIVAAINVDGLLSFTNFNEEVNEIVKLKKEYSLTTNPKTGVEIKNKIIEKNGIAKSRLDELYVSVALKNISILMKFTDDFKNLSDLFLKYKISKFKIQFKKDIKANDLLVQKIDALGGITKRISNGYIQTCFSNRVESCNVSNFGSIIYLIQDADVDHIEFSRHFCVKDVQDIEIFHWGYEFFNVFETKGGFDIITGNPPYVNNKNTSDLDKIMFESLYGSSDDLYNYFFKKSFKILKKSGILGYITSDSYMTIGTKRDLRKLLQAKRIIEIKILGANVFEGVGVSTNTIIVENEVSDNYELKIIDSKESESEYIININNFKNAPNNVFFIPTEIAMKMQLKFGKNLNRLKEDWWNKIESSKAIKANTQELDEYRKQLKEGDITLLGLITDGGVGLQTGDNGKYVGIIETHKSIEALKKKRIINFLKFLKSNNIGRFKSIKNSDDVAKLFETLGEKGIRELFDSLKLEYGRDVFGDGFLYRIIGLNEIVDVEKLSKSEKENGIDGKKLHYVPYDKGDKGGNKWYLETPYYISWRRENVEILKKDKNARWQGYHFYFREGFCWSDICGDTIKSRLKPQSVHDVKSMSLFSMVDEMPSWFLMSILNSKLISVYKYGFLNNTVSFQINDARQIPIVVPTTDQLNVFKKIFEDAVKVKRDEFNLKISESEVANLLLDIQIRLDDEILKLYKIL